jgi:AcrR family transcriptional regulator
MALPRPAEGAGTRERILAAAGELFAARGLRGATMREIAARAGTNLASANYHFGSKEALYVAVASEMFHSLGRSMAARGVAPEEIDLERMTREELVAMLRSRIEALLEALLTPPRFHAIVMLRELCDPTDALPEVVQRFIAPLRREMIRLVERLAPDLTRADAERCAEGLAGQAHFYSTHRPGILLLRGRAEYPRGFVRETAAHITEFSLGGIERIAAERRRERGET